jgi:hypothetical protein
MIHAENPWNSFNVVQLIATCAAIVATAIIAYVGWRRTYKDAIRQQKALARAEREQRSHDVIVDLLDEFDGLMGRALVLLFFLRGNLPDGSPDWRVQWDSAYQIARRDLTQVSDLVESLGGREQAIADAVVPFPFSRQAVGWLSNFPYAFRIFWDKLKMELFATDQGTSPPGLDVALDEAMTYIRMSRWAMAELRSLVTQTLIERDYEGESPPGGQNLASNRSWFVEEASAWTFSRTPPFLPDVFEPAGAEKWRQAYSAELKEHPFFGKL